MTQRRDDWEVTVCAECLTASCWHGEFMCDRSRHANVKSMRASELNVLQLEHPSNYSRQKIRLVTGEPPITLGKDESK